MQLIKNGTFFVLLLPALACAPVAVLDAAVTRDRETPADQAQDVLVTRGGDAMYVARGMRLEPGDDLRVGEATYAVVRFRGGSSAVLAPGCFAHLDADPEPLSLGRGTAIVHLEGGFQLTTPEASVRVRGTTFAVEARDQITAVTVLDGSVTLEPRDDSERKRVLVAGQRGIVRRLGSELQVAVEPVPASAVLAIAERYNRTVGEADGRGARLYVPTLVGMPLDEARATIEASGLTAGEVDGRITGAHPVDTVVDQDPTPGTVRPARKPVTLWFEAEPVEVPVLVGVHRTRALALLADAGLAVEEWKRATITGEVPENTVNTQQPAAGTVIRRGDPVQLRFEAASAVVPDLTGMTRAEAGDTLAELGLELGAAVIELYPSLGIEGIQMQSIAAGERVAAGTAVRVTVAVPAVETPAVVGMTLDEARGTFERHDLTVGATRYRHPLRADDERYRCSVTQQIPAAGEATAIGRAVDLRLSCAAIEP